MKKIFLLVGLFLLPFFATAQNVSTQGQAASGGETSSYTDDNVLDTAAKFERVKELIEDAETCLQLPRSKNISMGGYGCVYDIKTFKNNLESEELDAFLKDGNNGIVLSAVADYIADISSPVYHDNYEMLITLGIDPVEALVRTGNEDYADSVIEQKYISYSHWEIGYSYGMAGAIESIENIPVQTNRQEIEEIKTKLENEKPLVNEFKKEMRKIKKQNRHKRIKSFFHKTKEKVKNLEDKLLKNCKIFKTL